MFTSVLFAMPQMDSSTFTMFLSSIHPLRSQLTALTLRAYTIHLALSGLCCVLLEIFYSWVWLNCHVPEGKVHSLCWLDPLLPQGALPMLGTDGGTGHWASVRLVPPASLCSPALGGAPPLFPGRLQLVCSIPHSLPSSHVSQNRSYFQLPWKVPDSFLADL